MTTKKPTKQQRIDALLSALVTISAQTKGYTEDSQMGCLHEVAHKAVIEDSRWWAVKHPDLGDPAA